MKAARFIILGVALLAGGAAAFLVSGDDTPKEAPPPVVQLPTVDVLIAKSDINMGASVSAAELQWQSWPAASTGDSYVKQSDRPNAIEELAGSIARAPFTAGEPIRDAKLIKGNGSGYLAAILPAGMRAISTEISPETGAGGFILPTDFVDVILSRRDRVAERSTGIEVFTSETILTAVKVLAIDQTVEEKNGQRVVVGKTATLELSPRQAEILAVSRQTGSLSLALRSLVDANRPTAADDSQDRRRGMNMVRFGVTTPVNQR